MPQMKTVKVEISKTFSKIVKVQVPADLKEADEIERYIEEQARLSPNNKLLDATSIFGIEDDVGTAMDYEEQIKLQEEE